MINMMIRKVTTVLSSVMDVYKVPMIVALKKLVL